MTIDVYQTLIKSIIFTAKEKTNDQLKYILMASGFLGLLDDIAVLMDDVVVLSKASTEKTLGVLADDLAINADKASGFVPNRELPVLWKITKGSFLNKLIILPFIFLTSTFMPFLILPILFCGGIYLSFEGALNVYKMFLPKKIKEKKTKEVDKDNHTRMEAERIKSAILIDFILSIEIIVITLGTVFDETITIQIMVVTFIALLSTVGVYGLVALLVRMDDVGYRLISLRKNKFTTSLGSFLVRALPKIIRILKLVGTIAMIIVGGGIFVPNIHFIHEIMVELPALVADFIIGLGFGSIFLFLYLAFKRLFIN